MSLYAGSLPHRFPLIMLANPYLSMSALRVCVCVGGRGGGFVGGIWNAKLRELSITKITLLLTAPWRR